MNAAPERLTEVVRLCTELADRALNAQITGRRVPADQAIALAKGAQLLEDHGVDWPPLLAQVLHELAGNLDRGMADSAATSNDPVALPDVDLHGLTRFFAGVRKQGG